MRVLVIGSNGMAGHMITKYLKLQGYDVETAARKDADITLNIEDTVSVTKFFDKLDKYDFIINAAGVLVQASKDNPTRAIIVNSWFPRYLEMKLRESPTRLIHLSTDCVFDGQQGSYYENNAPTETNDYGRTKALGEVINNKDITFRMSIIGPELKNGTGLLHWALNYKDKIIPGWVNSRWNGITTLQLAKCLDTYMINSSATGLYHMVDNKVKTSKYELLCDINEVYGLGKTVSRDFGPKPVDKILVDTRRSIDLKIPNYKTQLQELKEFK
jgi:dTDP-4-dehydrorhamnose reductase